MGTASRSLHRLRLMRDGLCSLTWPDGDIVLYALTEYARKFAWAGGGSAYKAEQIRLSMSAPHRAPAAKRSAKRRPA